MKVTQENFRKSGQPYYQVLSLDVVLGAMSVGIFAVKMLSVHPLKIWWIILLLAVWSVYTLDHLVDGFKKKGESKIYRHKFHFENRRIIIPLVIISGATAVILSFLFLESQIIIYGVSLSLFVLFYFILVSFQEKLKIRYIQKEFFIMFVYISGILLAPFAWANKSLDTGQYFIFFILAALAWIESVMISYYDFNQDETDHLKSFTVVYGKTNTKNILTILLFSLIFLLITGLFFFDQGIFIFGLIIELVMALILLALIRFPEFFSRSGLFRWVGEAVFLLPALTIFI